MKNIIIYSVSILINVLGYMCIQDLPMNKWESIFTPILCYYVGIWVLTKYKSSTIK